MSRGSNTSPARRQAELTFYSATHEEIRQARTTDIYFLRAQEVLRRGERAQTQVTAEIFPSRDGVMAGHHELKALLHGRRLKVEVLPEGCAFEAKETIVRLSGLYQDLGPLETALLGILASTTAWAARTRECVEAAGGKPVLCFGARHLHPAVAPVMEATAKEAGAAGISCVLAAERLGISPSGTIPHACALIVGDTVEMARAFDATQAPDVPRIILVDTFKDEAEEALRVAEALGSRLAGVRLDTPSERGGVTPALVREVRLRLDMNGYSHVKIYVSGGLTPQRIRELAVAGADGFGVGSYISAAPPNDMTMDIKIVAGRPVAKRGRIPGLTPTRRLRPLRVF